MAKRIYIDGNVIATTGNLYTRNITAGAHFPSAGAEVIVPEGGTLWITQNTGSIFDTYYVNGEVTASGNEVGDVFAFGNIYEFTVRDYNERMSRLRGLLEVVVPSEYQQLFYQRRI